MSIDRVFSVLEGCFMNRYVTIFTICLALSASILQAQPGIEWERLYGGNNDNWFGNGMLQLEDGFLLFGRTGPPDPNRPYRPDHNMYLIKVDPDGEEVWRSVYGDTLTDEKILDVVVTADGGFAAVGMIGLDEANGGFFWRRLFLAKFDSDGDLEWQRNYYYTNELHAAKLIEVEDHGFYIAGSSPGFLLRVDEEGDHVWIRSYNYLIEDMIRLEEGEMLMCGYGVPIGTGYEDAFISKVDEDGEIIWSNHFGSDDIDDRSYSVTQKEDGGYALVGYSVTLDENRSVGTLVISINEDGNEVWQQLYYLDEEIASRFYFGEDIIQTDDGGFAILGQKVEGPTKMYLLRIDSEGELLWMNYLRGYDGRRSQLNDPGSFVIVDDGYMIFGNTNSQEHGEYNYPPLNAWLIKTEADPVSVSLLDPALPSVLRYSAYPNPFNGKVTIAYHLPRSAHIAIDIFDCNGRLVEKVIDGFEGSGKHSVSWDGIGMASGMYYYQIMTEDDLYSSKMSLIK